MAIIQVWTGPRCQAGSEPLGPVASIVSGRVVEATSGAQGPVLAIPRAVADTMPLRAGAWLWISHPRRGVSEWPILSVTDGDGRARDTVSVQGGTIRQALTLRGTIRRVNRFGAATTTFTLPALTPSELLAQYFFTNQAADNLQWLVPGLIEYEATIALGTIAQWTRGQLLDAIEQATGFRFAFTRIADSAYQLDLRDPARESGTTVLLAPGVSVDTIERTEDLVSSATVAEPRSTAGDALGETWWQVTAITGTGPYWVRLRDPASGRAVIGEDDQVNGWWLRPNDGLAVEITDSRVSDSAVQVASVEGVVVGGLASLWRTADGAFSAEVPSPSGIALRGRVVQQVTVAVPSMRANRVTDPALRNALASWEVVNPSAGGLDVLSRTDPVTIAMAANGAASAGATSIVVDGAPASAIIRRGDALTVAGTTSTGNANVTTSAIGGATVPLAAVLPSALADNTVLAWTRGGVDIGTVTCNGAQAVGASSLVLDGLPATPQLTSGDVLVKATAPTVYIEPDLATSSGWLNSSLITIPSGSTIAITRAWATVETVFIPGPVQVFRLASAISTGTTVGATAPGAEVSFTETSPPDIPVGASLTELSGIVTLAGGSGSWTITGTPPAWDASARATATITGTLGQQLAQGEVLRWLRGGVPIGDVRVTALTGSGSSTIPLEALNATRILNGDQFRLPPQTIYANAETVLSSTGTGTIALRAPLATGIADNAVLAIQRPRDLAGREFGGPNVLRMRGSATSWPATYKGGSNFGVYSPIMRVQSPDPTNQSGSYSIDIAIDVSTWSAEAGQSVSAFWAIWDVDTGERLTSGTLASGTAPFSPLYTTTTHATQSTFAAISAPGGPRRVRLSLHPGSNQNNNLGGYVYLRSAAVTVRLNGQPQVHALVDGGFSNQGWHRGNDLLDSTRDAARYRVQLGSVAPLADDPAQLISVGSTVRLRSDVLGVDRPFLVSRLTWSLRDDDALDLELAAATPRLTEST